MTITHAANHAGVSLHIDGATRTYAGLSPRWTRPTAHGELVVTITPTDAGPGWLVTRLHTRTHGAPLARRAQVGSLAGAVSIARDWLA